MRVEDELLLIETPCSVTMYGMKLQIAKDGRDRGLWFILEDERRKPPIGEAALIEWDELKKVNDLIGSQFRRRAQEAKKQRR